METQANITISPAKFNIGFLFVSLGVLISLITSVVSFLTLVFETLNKRFPDVLNATYQYGYSTYEYESIRMSLATLVIVFPVFLALSYFWNKLSKMHIALWDKFIRKWSIYIVLFLSSIVAVADLITLVKYFISGEITSRFIYKVITVLVVAGIVGFYYITLLREDETEVKSKNAMILAGVSLVLMIVAVSYSFMIIGSPMKQRDLRLDMRRVEDLQNLQWQVISFWQQKEKLPATLEELKNPLSGYSLPVEPEFEKGNKYEYKVVGPLTFELCATFSEVMPKGWQEYQRGGIYPSMPMYDKAVATSYPYPGGGVNESWEHDAGRTCFERTIDKDLYPPYPKPEVR